METLDAEMLCDCSENEIGAADAEGRVAGRAADEAEVLWCRILRRPRNLASGVMSPCCCAACEEDGPEAAAAELGRSGAAVAVAAVAELDDDWSRPSMG